MELQNQIYLLTAIFGGVCTLLLVFIVVLAIYVINLKKTVIVKEPERKYENYGFEHDVPVHNITDDLRSMKSEVNRRPPPHKSNLAKPRNDDTHIHNNVRRPEKRPSTAVMSRDERKRQYSESGDTSGRDFDSAFDNEINNMFDIDDEDDDQSVVSDRNSRYNQQGRQKSTAPPPPSVGISANRTNRNNQQQQMGRPARGNGNAAYRSGNPHEGKTYFNERATGSPGQGTAQSRSQRHSQAASRIQLDCTVEEPEERENFDRTKCEKTYTVVKVKKDPVGKCKICKRMFYTAESLQLHKMEHERFMDFDAIEPTINIDSPSIEESTLVLDESFYQMEPEMDSSDISEASDGAVDARLGPTSGGLRNGECKPIIRRPLPTPTQQQQQQSVARRAEGTIEGRFRCEICSKRFRFQPALNVHVRTHDDNNRPFQCRECQRRFVSRAKLFLHSYGHSRDRRAALRCDGCGDTFARNWMKRQTQRRN